MAKRDDDLKDSFYLYIMRNSIGAGLRTQYAPAGHPPDRIAELMHELDSAGGEDTNEPSRDAEKDRDRKPARKLAQKR